MDKYVQKILAINDEKFANSGKKPLAQVVTFGCQMNVHDSEKLTGILTAAGYGTTESQKDADIIVYNTCCVRENAENKVLGHLGVLKNIKQTKKNLKIVLMGCMMQQEAVVEKIMTSYRHVDVIFGTFNIHKFAELLYRNIKTGKMVIDVWDKSAETEANDELTIPVKRSEKFKASVNITYGCNNFCSYCIVPYVRGRERSRPLADILAEVETLAQDGVKEITLLGQNVNSYGTGNEDATSFPKLIEEIAKIEQIKRIRFLTSHPKDLSDELIFTMKQTPKVCKHIHLPVQSGSTEVLQNMNRKYTKEHYLTLVEKLRREIPDIAITTDIIIGFPGEREVDILDTIEVVESVEFSQVYTFIYSIRTGTPAAKMENQIPAEVVDERFGRVLKAVNSMALKMHKAQVGKTVSVLVESLEDGETSVLTGRTEDFKIVHFEGDKTLIGEIVNVKIVDCKTFYLKGEQIK